MTFNNRYVLNNLSDEDIENVILQLKKIDKKEITSLKYEEYIKALRKEVHHIFSNITSIQKYDSSSFIDPNDVENYNNVFLKSPESLNTENHFRKFGLTNEMMQKSIERVIESPGVVGRENMKRFLETIIERNLHQDELKFMREVEFLACLIKKYQNNLNSYKSRDDFLSFYKINEQKIKSFDAAMNVSIGSITLAGIAKMYLQHLINESDGRIIPDDYPTISIICGLPGTGKSSLFIKKLKSDGACCLDLDDIAVTISNRFNIQFDDITSQKIYNIANIIHDIALAKAIMQKYSIVVEKTGYSANQIIQIRDVIGEIEKRSNNGKSEYSYQLKMTAGSSIDSANSNAIRMIEQIISGKKIRGYNCDELLANRNCNRYAYAECISNYEILNKFSHMSIADREEEYSYVSIANNKKRHNLIRKEGKI